MPQNKYGFRRKSYSDIIPTILTDNDCKSIRNPIVKTIEPVDELEYNLYFLQYSKEIIELAPIKGLSVGARLVDGMYEEFATNYYIEDRRLKEIKTEKLEFPNYKEGFNNSIEDLRNVVYGDRDSNNMVLKILGKLTVDNERSKSILSNRCYLCLTPNVGRRLTIKCNEDIPDKKNILNTPNHIATTVIKPRISSTIFLDTRRIYGRYEQLLKNIREKQIKYGVTK